LEPVTSQTSPSTAPAEPRLVARATAGDIVAFARLVEDTRDIALRVAARLVGPQDAEDVAQDAFLRAFHRLGELRDPELFRAWLLRIVHNAAVDHLARRDRRRRVESAEPGEEQEVAEPSARTPARLLEDRERRQRLARKLGLLRPEHRVVLVLRDLEGLPYEEIAVATGMPLGSVKGRLHRARAELIEVLRNNVYDWELPDGD
jgi:RNA polymerase sigma-70 factor (ECF subfamily)